MPNDISEIGISLSKNDYSHTHTDYYGPGETYTWTSEFSVHSTAQFFQVHMVKKPFGSRNQNRFMVSVSEQLALNGDNFFDFSNSLKVLILGGHATCRLGPSPKAAILLSAGYLRSMVLNNHVNDAGLGIVTFRLGVAKFSATSVISLNFGFDHSDGRNSYGLALSLGQVVNKNGFDSDR